jgi:hypothetical protein
MQLGQWSISIMYTIKSIYYAYFNSVIIYGIILVGNSSYSEKDPTSEKEIVRIMARCTTQNFM